MCSWVLAVGRMDDGFDDEWMDGAGSEWFVDLINRMIGLSIDSSIDYLINVLNNLLTCRSINRPRD